MFTKSTYKSCYTTWEALSKKKANLLLLLLQLNLLYIMWKTEWFTEEKWRKSRSKEKKKSKINTTKLKINLKTSIVHTHTHTHINQAREGGGNVKKAGEKKNLNCKGNEKSTQRKSGHVDDITVTIRSFFSSLHRLHWMSVQSHCKVIKA